MDEDSQQRHAKDTISFDEFLKLDLRVAKVTSATNHPNADKLIVMQIDLGNEQRQIIAGLKPWYAPEDLEGKQIIVVANLAARKMRGMESNGMLLAASSGEGDDTKVVVLGPWQEVQAGSTVS